MKKAIVIGMATLLSNPLFAQQGEVTGNISRINNYEGHSGPLVGFQDMSNTNGFCERNDYFILPEGHDFYEQNYSLLLASMMANKQVTIGVFKGDCIEGMPRVRHVLITQ